MTTLNLTPLQIQSVRAGHTSIDLTDVQVAAVIGGAVNPPTTTPPTTTPPTIPPVPPTNAGGSYVLPPEVAGRIKIKVAMPWLNGALRIVADLNDSNVWALSFTPGPFTTARFAGAEWQEQQWGRKFALVRNRDGAVIAPALPFGVNSPSINLIPGIPPPRSGKYQVVPGEQYTLAIWNVAPTPAGAGRMFMELYFS